MQKLSSVTLWLVTVSSATYLLAKQSRSKRVLLENFNILFDVPVVTDGYASYNLFHTRQRCWIHLLLKAEKYAIRNRGTDLSCYRRLLFLYNEIKDLKSASTSECLRLQRKVMDIAYGYPKKHKFRTTLENASPYLFTFLQHPGMLPHNNPAELEVRDCRVTELSFCNFQK